VADLSDAESLLAHGPPESVWVACWDEERDGSTGAIEAFALEHPGSQRVFESSDPPVPVPDSGATAYARVRMSLAGIEEGAMPSLSAAAPRTMVVRGCLFLPPARRPAYCSLLACSGRKVMDLGPGGNDVSHLSPGVYFIRSERTQDATKVVVIR